MKVLAILYRGGAAAKEEPRLLGTLENELGLRQYLESQGHEFLVSDDKEGANSFFEKHIADVSKSFVALSDRLTLIIFRRKS